MATYTSAYPPAHNDTYVKALYSYGFYPYLATDPSRTVPAEGGGWLHEQGGTSTRRFHIDLGSAKIIRRIYYDNLFSLTDWCDFGVKDFTFWGSNEATSFAELTYGTDTGWTQLTTETSQFAKHPKENIADPHYILVTNTTAYRYYAFKFSTVWGGTYAIGLQKVELQTEDDYKAITFVPKIIII